MSANAHTAVMTDLEQRIQDGRQLSAPRPRINRIMEDRFYGRKPRVDIPASGALYAVHDADGGLSPGAPHRAGHPVHDGAHRSGDPAP